MTIQPILDKAANIAIHVVETGKQVALWTGRHVQAGYSKYAVPAASKAYSLAVAALSALGKVVQRGPGAVFGIAAVLFASGIAAFKIADRKAYDDNPVSKALWKTAGIAAFLGATAVTSIGIGLMITA